jgi:hypothetical protein
MSMEKYSDAFFAMAIVSSVMVAFENTHNN